MTKTFFKLCLLLVCAQLNFIGRVEVEQSLGLKIVRFFAQFWLLVMPSFVTFESDHTMQPSRDLAKTVTFAKRQLFFLFNAILT